MARKTVPEYVYLTPALFRRLDLIARRDVGRPIEVESEEAMEGCIGRLNVMCGDVCADTRTICTAQPNWIEMGVISLAPRIPVAKMYGSRRPEIDWSKVPTNRLFEFVVQHEIGHVRDNFDWLDLIKNLPADADQNEPPRLLRRLRGRSHAAMADSRC
jgi:hypothetical protein